MNKMMVIIFLPLLVACMPKEQKHLEAETSLVQSLPTEQEQVQELKPVQPLTFRKDCVNASCQSYIHWVSADSSLFKVDKTDSHNHLTAQDLQKLVELITQLKLTSMQTQITPGNISCPSYTSDHSSYQLEIDKGDFSQTLDIYAGCQNIENKYLQLINWFESKSTGASER